MLTFMYDEDRQTALAMYGRMFDETADEDGLLELLVSPTRQAVVLARSYDAKARKSQMELDDSADFSDPDNVPAFIFIIDKTAQQALELGVKDAAPVEGQFSIFDELPELEEVLPAPAEAELEAEEEPVPEAEIDAQSPPEAEAMAEAETEAEPETRPEPAEEAEAAAPAALPELYDEPEAMDGIFILDAERSDVDDTADAVEAFLADFTIENGELVSTKPEPAPAAPAALPELELAPPAAAAEPKPAKPAASRVKTNILLLILYIFLAIPVGIIGVAVLLILTALFLALGSCCGYIGVSAIAMSFGSFAVIADTMAVFGAGLALVALALLFVWMFIWLLGGATVGFIRGLCVLGRKLCCKEVAVQ